MLGICAITFCFAVLNCAGFFFGAVVTLGQVMNLDWRIIPPGAIHGTGTGMGNEQLATS